MRRSIMHTEADSELAEIRESRAPTTRRPDPIRQSLIAKSDGCMYSVKLALQDRRRSPSMLAARGTLFHAWVAAALEILREKGERKLPIDVGLELLAKVEAQRDIPSEEFVQLPMSEEAALRALVVRWCERGISHPERIQLIEHQLEGEIPVYGPDETIYRRRISGRPDVIVSDPPDGIIIVDWKSGAAPPPGGSVANEEDPENRARKRARLSDHGIIQQIVYGILGLQNLPAVNRVTLREVYAWRFENGKRILDWSEYRQSTVERSQLERYLDPLSRQLSWIDAALDEGWDSPRWTATPGMWCGFCPNPMKCPIKEDALVAATDEEAMELFKAWHVSAERRKRIDPMLKAWTEANGDLELEDGRLVGWHPNKDGDGRRYGIYERDDTVFHPFDTQAQEAR